MQDYQAMNGEQGLPRRTAIQPSLNTHTAGLPEHIANMRNRTPGNQTQNPTPISDTGKPQREPKELKEREGNLIYDDDANLINEHGPVERLTKKLLNYEHATLSRNFSISWGKVENVTRK